jgi:hypothetical protein
VRVALGIVAGLVLLALAVVLLAPASLVDPLLVARTGGRVRLVDAGGLWWRGHGTLATANGDARMPIAWHVALLPLATRTLDLELVPAEATMPRGELRVAHDAVDARDLHVALPAALLRAFAPALEPLALGGDIDVSTASFTWRPRQITGKLAGVWRESRLAIVGIPVTLGRVVTTVSGTGDAAQGAFDNSGGELAVHGTWRAIGDRLEAATTLTPTSATSPALRALLPMLGQVDAQGRVRLTWQDRR